MLLPATNSGQVRKLADVALACPVGGIVSFGQLSDAVGFAITGRRYLIQAAFALANKESGATFRNVRNAGYRRLAAGEVHTVFAGFRAKTRRLGKRAAVKVGNALSKANDMSGEARLKIAREQALCGLIIQMSYHRNLPVLRKDSPPPPLDTTVRTSVKMLREHLTVLYG